LHACLEEATENAGVKTAGADSKGIENAGEGKPHGKPNRQYTLRDP